MISDYLLEKGNIRWQQGENARTQYGSCKFCGQMRRLEFAEPYTDAECNECATEMCGCVKSQNYVLVKRRKERGYKQIELKFGEGAEEDGTSQPESILELLRMAVDRVADEEVAKVSVKIDGTLKAEISLTAKGMLKLERTMTIKNSVEV